MTTLSPKHYSLDDVDALDVMAPKEQVALLMMDVPELLWDACIYYLNHRPDRWAEIAEHYFQDHNWNDDWFIF